MKEIDNQLISCSIKANYDSQDIVHFLFYDKVIKYDEVLEVKIVAFEMLRPVEIDSIIMLSPTENYNILKNGELELYNHQKGKNKIQIEVKGSSNKGKSINFDLEDSYYVE